MELAAARPRRMVRQAIGRLGKKRRDRTLPMGFETQGQPRSCCARTHTRGG